MTSIDLDDYILEEESEASPPMSIFQHLYQSPAAAAPPPPARLPAASTRDDDEQLGPRFKDQARPDLLQPATVPSAIREEPTIPFASALLVPESQIEREHRVQSEMERQLDLERQQLELERQRLELVERQQMVQLRQQQQLREKQELETKERKELERQLRVQQLVREQEQQDRQRQKQQELERQQQEWQELERQRQQQDPHQNDQSVSKKRWIGGMVLVVVVLVVLVAGVAGFCGTGNCRGSSPSPSTVATEGTSPTIATAVSISPSIMTSEVPFPNQTTTSSRANSIRSFINLITLTGQSLQYPSSATAEERALQWLIDVDRDTSESNMIALHQRFALATLWFQRSTGFGSSGWATGITECDWQGVDCDDDGHLVTYLVPIGDIGGRIPADLGLLTDLIGLYLNANALTGTIPSSLVSLTDLKYLHLYDNGLTGTMPFCISGSNRSFDRLVTDCDKVSCPCCTHCCPTSRDGIPVYGFAC